MQPNNQSGPYYGPASPQYSAPPNNPLPSSSNYSRNTKKVWVIATIVLAVLVLIMAGFAVWAYMESTKYKNNANAIAAEIANVEVEKAVSAKENEFIEREKQPLKDYESPNQFGSLKVKYPKTWSAYIIEEGSGNTPIDGYFHPSFVPGIDSGIAFALRVQVINETYDTQLKGFERQVEDNTVTVAPFRMEKVPDVLGSRVVGEINRGQQGTLVLLPLRDKTLKISTEATTFLKDFDEIILRNFEFTP